MVEDGEKKWQDCIYNHNTLQQIMLKWAVTGMLLYFFMCYLSAMP